MANPVGEDSWLAYVEEESRHASDLEGRVKVVELFKKAIVSEPGSLKIWLAYCEYFWSLFTDSQSNEASWPDEEQQLGRELFSFDSALSLWSEGYEGVKFRLNDSHEFWNRWVSIEQEQLARTRTQAGVERISHLFRDRLQIPHATWDNTSQMFSSFLSTYNNDAYELEFKEVTATARLAKEAYEQREPYELKLKAAAASGDEGGQKAIMKQYLDWEMMETKQNKQSPAMAVTLCLALYSRALTSIFAFDDEIWSNYAVFLSSLKDNTTTSHAQSGVPDPLNVLQRATTHCPWAGMLWSRYILSAEEAGWKFQDIEHIKHAATNAKELDKNGMTGVIEMYAAWCGYLKRTAMNPNASDDAADIADVGLTAALEDVQLWGERLYKTEYRGDPNYRIERIVVQYLTEKKGEVDEARMAWNRMAEKPLMGNSYDFWLNYYLWEMMIYASQARQRSPTPATPANGAKQNRVPAVATNVLMRALRQRGLDWPERIMEVFHQHCNDYESPETLRRALDTIHKTRRGVAKRREREQAAAAAAYAAQAPVQQQTPVTTEAASVPDSPSGSKRKRGETPEESTQPTTKRVKSAEVNGTDAAATEQSLKRDRENTSVMVRNLPAHTTLTAIRKYFRDYGHVVNVTTHTAADGASSSALVEFESPEEMQSALLRDNKYFGESQINVKPGTGLTIYVTNYPPTADENYIRHLFKDCGEIFGIRFPSLKYNTHRRFCYISFQDTDGAAKATQLEGKVLERKFKLVSKYSEPTRKKQREGASSEGRELRIKNFDQKSTEAELQTMFAKYGKVQAIRIIQNAGGQNVGTAYVVFETKEQAEAAVDLDKTKLRSNIIQVELTKEINYKPFASTKGGSASAASSPAHSADADVAMSDDGTNTAGGEQGPSRSEIQARTMSIMNLPDTVNDARVRELVEKYGDLVKLVLRPDHQGAIVEYKEVGAVGRAMLGIEGFEIAPGRKLRTGTVGQLLKEKSETRIDKIDGAPKPAPSVGKGSLMLPPQTIRRSALGSGGRAGRSGGPKRGLGFVATKKKTEEEQQNGTEKAAETNGTESVVKPKSNSEFKAMFLGEEKSS